MKHFSLLAISLLLCGSARAEEKSGAWKEVVESDDGKYAVSFSPEADKVDVTKLDEKAAAPSAVKLKLHRKNKRPIELKLRTLETPNQPIRYEGDLRQWKDQSVVGFELDLSFDKKTWKSVKKFFGAK